MTDRELNKLKRQDLLVLLLETEKENRRLRKALAEAREQLNSRALAISETGNLAEAALRLSGVFEDAQKAADVYLENVRKLCQAQETESREIAAERVRRSQNMLSAAEEKCRAMEDACRARCESMAEEVHDRTAPAETGADRRSAVDRKASRQPAATGKKHA